LKVFEVFSIFGYQALGGLGDGLGFLLGDGQKVSGKFLATDCLDFVAVRPENPRRIRLNFDFVERGVGSSTSTIGWTIQRESETLCLESTEFVVDFLAAFAFFCDFQFLVLFGI
jgi:hypothetical protein